jgi:hypothetical protein
MLNQLKQKFPLLYNIFYENYKGLTQNFQWLLMRKLSRFHLVRLWRQLLVVKTIPIHDFTINQSSTLFPNVNIDLAVKSLKKDGFYLDDIHLPEDIVQEIVSFAYSHPCYAYRKPHLGFYYDEKELAEKYYHQTVTLAGYFNTSVLCTAINQLKSDPKLLAIAAKYLEHEPVHQSNQLWWSFAGEVTNQQQMQTFQMFHYDFDDYRFLKFFFYLTNVDASAGPHVCVRGSHRQKKFSYLILPKSETDEEIINYYGKESLVTICGEAGFGFAEDTFCFHKGTTPITQDRLMLQVEFGTIDYGMQHDILDPSLLKSMSNTKSITVNSY